MLRTVVEWNRALSRRFDLALPAEYRDDGNRDFVSRIVPSYLRPGMTVVDVGAGRHPCISIQEKNQLGILVIGLDIDPSELAAAPEGSYDRTICVDLAKHVGAGDADLVICQALLEHVRDIEGAFAGIASTLRIGGKALVFVPSRNAIFARINMILPQSMKRALLFGIFPHAREGQGFRSFYHQCTPKRFRVLAARNGLEVLVERPYWFSDYFSFLFPLHVLWRAWLLLFRKLRGIEAAETFAMVFVRTR